MLINLRNALMAGKRLPYDAEVEYLEGTGTQWIDTGVTPDFSLSMSATLCRTDTTSGFIFGARQANATNSFCLASFSTYARFDFGGTGSFSGQTNISPICDGNMHTISVAYPTITLDGESNTMASAASFSINRNIVLFANNTNGSITKYSGVRIAALKLYSNSVLVRDFIPVRVGTVGYLYDRVSGRLFGNAGTGDFVLGPDVVPVEYIESHGTEWIDLGTTVPPDSDFEFTGSIVSDMSNGCIFGETNVFSWGASNPGYALVTTSNGQIYLRYGDSTATIIGLTSIGLGNTFTASLSGTSFQINRQSVATISRISSFTGSVSSMDVFRRNYTNYAASTYSVARINNLKFGNLFNLTPVRVGSGTAWEGAMMDVLTRRIYRNAGTGAFTYGNDLKYPFPKE